MNQRRIRRGSLEFDLPECRILLDDKGKPVDVTLYERGISNRIIEEFMLICNETVAEHMAHLDLPLLYRVHEVPDPDRVTELGAFMAGFGLTLRGLKNGLHPKSLQAALSKVAGRPEEAIVNRVALRSLKKARYAPENLGHFGLAAEFYCHFTSPIRRYPDLVVHRVVKETLRGKLTKKRFEQLSARMPSWSSQRANAPPWKEREVDDLKNANTWRCMWASGSRAISGVTSFGLFVSCQHLRRSGAHCRNVGRLLRLRKELPRCGQAANIYRLGDTVTIEVTGADPPPEG